MLKNDMAVRSPAHAFMELWEIVAGLSGFARTTYEDPGQNFKDSIDFCMQADNASEAYDKVRGVIENAVKGRVRSGVNGILIVAMQRIDWAFLKIHPRVQNLPPALATPTDLPNWLREQKSQRIVDGCYLRDEEVRLICRGPLQRLPRAEFSSNAEDMVDMFVALAVAPNYLERGRRRIDIDQVVIPVARSAGISSGGDPGKEKIAFVPIFEDAGDLHMSAEKIEKQDFVDFRMAPGINAAKILDTAIRSFAEPIDIVLAPELVMSEKHCDEFASNLDKAPLPTIRMILAGSGNTEAISADGIPWNEARVLNGRGHEIWRQRKLWPASLSSLRATQYAIPHTGSSVLEKNAEGECLVIADVDGLGRCVILICQDVEARPLAEDLIRQFQPDWVIVPILDPGIEPGRWVHQRTFALSNVSNARYLVVSSTGLSKVTGASQPVACGIAVGPISASADGEDAGRVFVEAIIPSGNAIRLSTITWRAPGWQLTQMGTGVPLPKHQK